MGHEKNGLFKSAFQRKVTNHKAMLYNVIEKCLYTFPTHALVNHYKENSYHQPDPLHLITAHSLTHKFAIQLFMSLRGKVCHIMKNLSCNIHHFSCQCVESSHGCDRVNSVSKSLISNVKLWNDMLGLWGWRNIMVARVCFPLHTLTIKQYYI